MCSRCHYVGRDATGEVCLANKTQQNRASGALVHRMHSHASLHVVGDVLFVSKRVGGDVFVHFQYRSVFETMCLTMRFAKHSKKSHHLTHLLGLPLHVLEVRVSTLSVLHEILFCVPGSCFQLEVLALRRTNRIHVPDLPSMEALRTAVGIVAGAHRGAVDTLRRRNTYVLPA